MTDHAHSYQHSVYAGVLALLVGLLVTPLVARIARRRGWVDTPGEERRVHEFATPLLGGVAMLISLLVGTISFAVWHVHAGERATQLDQLTTTLIAAVCATALGAWDDIRLLGWKSKITGQIAVALFAIFGPLAIGSHTHSVKQLILLVHRLDPPILSPFSLPTWLGAALATLWIVAMMNMVNFIDGVDGLAGGICGISAATFAVIAASYQRMDVAVLSAATCGAALGFLRSNFRSDRATIFMGDSGSLLLGFLLAVIAIEGVLKTAAAVSLVIPLALLALPILDTIFVISKRVKYKQSVAHADRWHLHHRLLNIGYSPRRVAVSFWVWSASMSAVALSLRFVKYGAAGHLRPKQLSIVGAIAAVALGISLYLVVQLEIIKVRRVRERNAALAARIADTELGAAPADGAAPRTHIV